MLNLSLSTQASENPKNQDIILKVGSCEQETLALLTPGV